MANLSSRKLLGEGKHCPRAPNNYSSNQFRGEMNKKPFTESWNLAGIQLDFEPLSFYQYTLMSDTRIFGEILRAILGAT